MFLFHYLSLVLSRYFYIFIFFSSFSLIRLFLIGYSFILSSSFVVLYSLFHVHPSSPVLSRTFFQILPRSFYIMRCFSFALSSSYISLLLFLASSLLYAYFCYFSLVFYVSFVSTSLFLFCCLLFPIFIRCFTFILHY